MKTSRLRFIIFTLLSIVSVTSKAQSAWSGPECLGTHCYISVYINRDPVVDSWYLKYTINVPAEGAVDVQGPMAAFLFNNLGNTVDLYISKTQLDLIADGVNCEIPIELWVNKWITVGSYKTQCFYWIKLLVNYD